MGFIDEIKKTFGEAMPVGTSYRAVIFGDDCVYLENVRSIESYSPERISLRLKQGGISIAGERLFIKKYCDGDVAVCGKIRCLERT